MTSIKVKMAIMVKFNKIMVVVSFFIKRYP
jgi:hypothetical protein